MKKFVLLLKGYYIPQFWRWLATHAPRALVGACGERLALEVTANGWPDDDPTISVALRRWAEARKVPTSKPGLSAREIEKSRQ